MVEIERQLVEGEIHPQRFWVERFGDFFETTHQQASGIRLEIDTVIGIAHDGRTVRDVDRFRHHIEVFRRVQRHAGAGTQREISAPKPGGEHHLVAAYLSLVGGHACNPAVFGVDVQHLDVFQDARTVCLCQPGQCLGRVDGIGLPVSRHVYATFDVAEIKVRPAIGEVVCREPLTIHRVVARHRGLSFELYRAPLGGGQGHRAHAAKADGIAGGFQLLVEFGGIAGEPRQVGRGSNLANQSGGVPSRTAGQRPAFQQADVDITGFGQMVSDAGADDTAADDDHLCSLGYHGL